MHLKRLSPAVGVEVAGLDVGGELDGAVLRELEETLDRESLILLRGQRLSQEQGRQLFDHFGPRIPGVSVVTNDAPTGRGELEFHSEQSFQRKDPIRGLALYGKTISAGGGATLFINCAAAFQSLAQHLQDRLMHTDTVHSFDPRVRLKTGYDGPEIPDGGWRTVHPAVLRHPVTGASILFVSPWFTTAVMGCDDQQGAALLSGLFVIS